MPMLPSGRHVGLSPHPLVQLLENASHFGNVHKVMALKSWSDLYPWIEVLFFLPEAKLEDRDTGELSDDSLAAPPGMVAVRSGYRLTAWEALAADWSEADRTAMREFLDGRAREHYGQYLDHVRGLQEKLRSAEGGALAQILATWHDVGVHPSQEEGWEEDGQARGDTSRRDAH
jgi:hypothetical protein